MRLTKQFLSGLIVCIAVLMSGCHAPAPPVQEPQPTQTDVAGPAESRWTPSALVTESLLPVEDFSSEREETVTHVMVHFMSALLTSPDNPFSMDAVRDIFINAGVSVHYVIDREGVIYRLIPENRTAWHAGKGEWNSDVRYTNRMNHFSVGIELLAMGTQEEMSQYVDAARYAKIDPSCIGFTDEQYASLKLLIDDIIARNPGVVRDRAHIIGHDEYSKAKTDPGSLFDWTRIIKK